MLTQTGSSMASIPATTIHKGNSHLIDIDVTAVRERCEEAGEQAKGKEGRIGSTSPFGAFIFVIRSVLQVFGCVLDSVVGIDSGTANNYENQERLNSGAA